VCIQSTTKFYGIAALGNYLFIIIQLNKKMLWVGVCGVCSLPVVWKYRRYSGYLWYHDYQRNRRIDAGGIDPAGLVSFFCFFNNLILLDIFPQIRAEML
jgi:hypothetical protein